MRFRFTAPLWEWSGEGAWFFVTLPEEAADDIREVPRIPRGFGSVRVRVTVGSTIWSTSVFPDSKRGSYLLPIKKAVRTAEGLAEGDDVPVVLEVLDL
jgi:hypothetical protein